MSITTTPTRVCAVIVTYNRKILLMQCLAAISEQTRKPDYILLVDNASTDGTAEILKANGWLSRPDLELLTLSENTGGAGGFAAGLSKAMTEGTDWAWMMDDDAKPHPAALEELMKVADNPKNIYGSLAVNGDDTAWTTTLMDERRTNVDKAADVPALASVQSLPFLGFLIHRSLMKRIGLPSAGYFIAADDVEYCMRAQQVGADIFIVGKSHIEHPKSDRYVANLPGRQLICLRLPPWKRYYDTRNRLLIARKYYGAKLFTQTIPASFIRLIAALVHEPKKLLQLWAFMAGLIDGLMGMQGRRHQKWGIPH